jgi:hypothetical protein
VERNHGFVIAQHADEGLDLLYVARQCDLKDCIDLLLLWFDTFSHKYVAEGIREWKARWVEDDVISDARI